MRIGLLSAVLLVFNASALWAQADLDKLVATERAFAKAAQNKGTRAAFLEFMAGDGVVFVPAKTGAKTFWTARPESTSALIWAPNYGDISANGILGYTTGNWEFRAKGRSDGPSAFGNFVTVWLRQPSGEFRWVIDIGVSHAKPEKYSEQFTPPKSTGAGNPKHISAADSANGFYEMVAKQGIQKAYAAFADEDVRFFRENEMPSVGKKRLIDRIKRDKGIVAIPKRNIFFESADIAYVNDSYVFTPTSGSPVTGNFLQIWKLIDGRWKIVLDIFKPVPQNLN